MSIQLRQWQSNSDGSLLAGGTFVALLLLGVGNFRLCHAQNAPGDPLCGAKCLYTGLLAIGIDPGEYHAFLDRCSTTDLRGHSLGHLDELAHEFGAKTLAVQTDLKHLALRKEAFSCIAHVDGNHFVLIGDVADGVVWIHDPNDMVPSRILQNIFESRWDGRALLLSKSPLVPDDLLRRPVSNWPILLLAFVVVAGLALLWWRRS